jgi:hypothetical protein
MITVFRKRSCLAACALLLLLVPSCAFAKDASTVIDFPDAASPVVRFTIGKLHALSSAEHQPAYAVATQVQNLWVKPIPEARFSLDLFDRKDVRVGEGFIAISNLAPGETARFTTYVTGSGQAVSFKVAPQSLPEEWQSLLPPKTVFLNVNSVPQGAHFTLDGRDAGTTPKAIDVTVGTHALEFDKEGFSRGKYLFSVGPDDAGGGSVSYELGPAHNAQHDTIEMRDGAIVTGDLESISATEVVVKVAGDTRTLDRAQVRRITLAQHSSTASQKSP